MRASAAPLSLVFFTVSCLVFAGCDEPEKIFVVSPPAGGTPTTTPPPPAPVFFEGDARTSSDAVAVLAGRHHDEQGPSTPDDVWLYAIALWQTGHPLEPGEHLTSVDVLVRIDPRSNPELLGTETTGSWCPGSGAQVTATGRPGEWRIQRSPASDDCTCGDPHPGIDTDVPYTVGGVRLKIHAAGKWRVDVAPATGPPACDCPRGCINGMSFFGGTLNVPQVYP